jgi:hypothetical protein
LRSVVILSERPGRERFVLLGWIGNGKPAIVRCTRAESLRADSAEESAFVVPDPVWDPTRFSRLLALEALGVQSP